jgi:hypothetical protein
VEKLEALVMWVVLVEMVHWEPEVTLVVLVELVVTDLLVVRFILVDLLVKVTEIFQTRAQPVAPSRSLVVTVG